MSKTDLEVSTFQNRPAYRYVRLADHLPREVGVDVPFEQVALKVKLFDPQGSWTWYLASYDPETRIAWGLVDGHEAEVGSFDMAELTALRGRFGLPLERDLYWKPRDLESVMREKEAAVRG